MSRVRQHKSDQDDFVGAGEDVEEELMTISHDVIGSNRLARLGAQRDLLRVPAKQQREP
jgi:hypothetical protein